MRGQPNSLALLMGRGDRGLLDVPVRLAEVLGTVGLVLAAPEVLERVAATVGDEALSTQRLADGLDGLDRSLVLVARVVYGVHRIASCLSKS